MFLGEIMTTNNSLNNYLSVKPKTISLFELRKEFKQKFAELDIDTEDADFIIAEVLNTKRTELVLIDFVRFSELETGQFQIGRFWR